MLLHIDTPRLRICPFTQEMAYDVHRLSLDADNRAFNPDEVFETERDASQTLAFLCGCYGKTDGPLVYAVTLKGAYIGHVELVPLDDGTWEIGYHIGKPYTGNGYATEAVCAFLPEVMQVLNLRTVYGVCIAENTASCRVLEHCGFNLLHEGDGTYQDMQRRIRRYEYSLT